MEMPEVAPLYPETRAKFPWLPEMGEISGFGGGYEETCRNMLYGALAYLDEHCTTQEEKINAVAKLVDDLRDRNYKNNGIEKAIMKACENDCTGAMHNAAVSHLMFLTKNGYEKYKNELIEREKKEKNNAKI